MSEFKFISFCEATEPFLPPCVGKEFVLRLDPNEVVRNIWESSWKLLFPNTKSLNPPSTQEVEQIPKDQFKSRTSIHVSRRVAVLLIPFWQSENSEDEMNAPTDKVKDPYRFCRTAHLYGTGLGAADWRILPPAFPATRITPMSFYWRTASTYHTTQPHRSVSEKPT